MTTSALTLRNQVIRLAHETPELRPVLLDVLRRTAKEMTRDEWKDYKREHPGADPTKHTITDPKGKPKKAPDKKHNRGEGGKVAPQTSPHGAYAEVKRVQDWEWAKKKTKHGPSTRDPANKAINDRISRNRRDLHDELSGVLKGRKDPNLGRLKKLLKSLKDDLYPLGGVVAPGGRRFRNLIKMIDQVGGTQKVKKASRELELAVYRYVFAALT